MRNQYYSRVVWRKENRKQDEKLIPLRTDKKSEAVVRNTAVTKVEDTIKNGENWSFPWMSEDGKVKLIRRSISETFEEYKVVQNINGVRASTLDRISYSMNTFTKVFGESFPVETVTESHIDEWKKYWHKEHSPNTVNIDLSKIKAFLNWCYKKGYMPRKLDFVIIV